MSSKPDAVKGDPWYISAVLWVVIAALSVILVKVAILDPSEIVAREEMYKKEARLRMENLKYGQILWEEKHGYFTADLDSLITFIREDPFVDSVRNAYDSLTRRSADPFLPLMGGEFVPDSLYRTPKTNEQFVLEIDTSIAFDSVISSRGRFLRVDTVQIIGSMYMITDPAGFGYIGDLGNVALKHSESWK